MIDLATHLYATRICPFLSIIFVLLISRFDRNDVTVILICQNCKESIVANRAKDAIRDANANAQDARDFAKRG